jgi:hypothetical protein
MLAPLPPSLWKLDKSKREGKSFESCEREGAESIIGLFIECFRLRNILIPMQSPSRMQNPNFCLVSIPTLMFIDS